MVNGTDLIPECWPVLWTRNLFTGRPELPLRRLYSSPAVRNLRGYILLIEIAEIRNTSPV